MVTTLEPVQPVTTHVLVAPKETTPKNNPSLGLFWYIFRWNLPSKLETQVHVSEVPLVNPRAKTVRLYTGRSGVVCPANRHVPLTPCQWDTVVEPCPTDAVSVGHASQQGMLHREQALTDPCVAETLQCVVSPKTVLRTPKSCVG